jgi:hypothetical protein
MREHQILLQYLILNDGHKKYFDFITITDILLYFDVWRSKSWTSEEMRFVSQQRQQIFLHRVQASSGAHRDSCETKAVSPKMKRPEREIDHTCILVPRLRNHGAIPQVPYNLHGIVRNWTRWLLYLWYVILLCSINIPTGSFKVISTDLFIWNSEIYHDTGECFQSVKFSWLLYVPPGLMHFVHRMYFCVSYDSHTKQPYFT